MCDPITLTVAALAASTGASMINANQQQKAAQGAANKAAAAADKNAEQQQEAVNKANAQSPDVNALMQANANASKTGVSSTMLTGPTGVDTSQLQLGKNTLLGS